MKTSEKKQVFETGANRDSDDNKGNPSLISAIATYRKAIHLQKGAKHYEAYNWQKGMPFTRTADSMYRHLIQWLAGDNSEDHLAAIAFGADALMHFEAAVAAGELPDTLDDRNKNQAKTLQHYLTSLMGDTTIPQKGELKKPVAIPYCVNCGFFPGSNIHCFEHRGVNVIANQRMGAEGGELKKSTPYCSEGHWVYNSECSECERTRTSPPVPIDDVINNIHMNKERFKKETSVCCGTTYQAEYLVLDHKHDGYSRLSKCKICGRKLNYV